MAPNLIPSSSQQVLYTESGILVYHRAWTPSSDDSWRLNFAGYLSEFGYAGGGCILRDQNFIFKAACAIPIWNCSSIIVAELEALIHGLKVAIEHGVNYLEIEGDYSIAIRMLAGEITPISLQIQDLLKQCFYLFGHIQSVKVRQIVDHANKAANKVASMGTERCETFHWLITPPKEISDILIFDVIGRWVLLSAQ